jgi:hypothetical protein
MDLLGGRTLGRNPQILPSFRVSRHLRGEMRDLPATAAGVARHPPIGPTQAVLDLQEDPENGGIGLACELALACVAARPRIERVEPNTRRGGRTIVLLPALTNPGPVAALDLAPLDFYVGGGQHELAAVGMAERPCGRTVAVLFVEHVLLL